MSLVNSSEYASVYPGHYATSLFLFRSVSKYSGSPRCSCGEVPKCYAWKPERPKLSLENVNDRWLA